MKFDNLTPFPAVAWETVNFDNDWFASNLARVKFKLTPGESQGELLWQLHSEQGELFSEDKFYRDDMDSSLRYESDYVPYKPYTDIVANAKACRPDDEILKSWNCGIRVYAPDHKTLLNEHSLLVIGPHKTLLRAKVDEVAIRYEKCKGGILKIKNKGKDDEEVILNMYNPVGCGKYDLEDKNELCSIQIEYAGKYLKNIPPGFGFIHRSWKSRLDYAGTYDDDWRENRHPLPPEDFSSFYNQAAHPNLIMKSYIEPGSKVVLTNLINGYSNSYFIVPDYKFLARITTGTESLFVRMNLDTLLIDIDSDDKEDFAVYASWRSYTKIDDVLTSEVMLVQKEGENNV